MSMKLKSLFDPAVRIELVGRIQSLTENSTAQWGKMNVQQMARHCIIWNQWVLGPSDLPYKQSLLGKVFGKMALKSNLNDDRPLQRKMPAGKGFTVKAETSPLEPLKEQWVATIQAYEKYSNPAFVHDFFGEMTQEQIGQFGYKHMDHHLRQFGV